MQLKERFLAAARGFKRPERVLSDKKLAEIRDIENQQYLWQSAPARWDRVFAIAKDALGTADVSSGRMLEIGGRHNPRNSDFSDFEYEALDLEGAPSGGIVVRQGDITECPEIPDETYDFVFSLDVFEHIDKPWLAASEIKRILKPGGVTMHSTLFAWRYHPCPIDYWRYTHQGLKSLFDPLECVHADFDDTERRRDLLGRGKNRLKLDALGGFRENIRVNYAGIKR